MDIGDFGNIYLSVFKRIQDSLTEQGLIVSGHTGGVTLLDAYPDDDQIKHIIFRSDSTGDSNEIILPIISIEPSNMILNDYELGSTSKLTDNRILSTIISETNIQRFQLMNAMYEAINGGIAYYDFDSNFSNPTSGTNISVTDISITPTNFVGSPNPAVKWGADISFKVDKVIV